MYDDIDSAAPFDFDDLDLPDPEDDDEDVSEEPTAVASTEEILAAVTARIQAVQSIGEVELDVPADVTPEDTSPTLAHQPVHPTPAQAAAPAPQPVEDSGSRIGALLVAVLLMGLLLGAAALLTLKGA